LLTNVDQIDQLAKSLATKTRERDEWVQKSVELESALRALIKELETTKLRKEKAKKVKEVWEISKKSLNEYEDEFDEAERYEQANAPFSTLNDALKHEEEKVGRLEQDAVRNVSVIESQIKSKQEEIAAHKMIQPTTNFDYMSSSKAKLEKQRSELENQIETLKQQANKYFGNISEAEQSSKSAAEKYETDTLELATAITDRDWHINHVDDLKRELALKGKAIQEAQNNESKSRNKLRTEELALRNEYDNLHRTSQFVQNANIRILGLRQQIYDAHSYFTNARENIAKQVALLKEVVDSVESIALQKYKNEIETLKRRNADLEQEIAQLRSKPVEQEPVVEDKVVVEERKAVQEEKLVTEHRHVVVDETVVTDAATGKVVEDKVNITESITSVDEDL
jgi:DNA repair exonuclease SbcCD ATPase subunit